MQTAYTIDEVRACRQRWRDTGETVALVPTMGNLHEGHLHLIDEACRLGSRTVVSVFVNPSQFVAGEDFESYPRTLNQDIERMGKREVDLLFVPEVASIYTGSGLTAVNVDRISTILCGASRPGHFQGVATIVCKLFNIVQPEIAVFGEKDYQQLLVIRQMVADLDIAVAIHGVATVRAPDGLALSSRNAYLGTRERRVASMLFRLLREARDCILGGETDFSRLEQEQMNSLHQAGFAPEYFSVRRAGDLMPAGRTDRQLVIVVAARLGGARLIDNIQFNLAEDA